MQQQLKFAPIARNQTLRIQDNHGAGHFGASRGIRSHLGLDIAIRASQRIFSPIEGKIQRITYPYQNDLTYRGLVIQGSGDWENYRVVMFYLISIVAVNKQVMPGDVIGTAQKISDKYQGITDHIHLELWHRGRVVNPQGFM
jgi:hypothetical protein